MKVFNLTPHIVNIVDEKGKFIDEFPSGGIARVTCKTEQVGEVKGRFRPIPLYRTEYGDIEGLPPYREGVCYIVSRLVATAAAQEGRSTSDLLIPANLVRDAQGRVIGAQGFEGV